MTTIPAPLHRFTVSPLHALLYATFLACSWTWCIGMFLPVLLVRDYGVWGWVVFAVPNVIGAAAMGWVIRSPAQSTDIVAAHRSACSAFSLVTIAFQVYFAKWFVSSNSQIAYFLGFLLVIVLLVWAAFGVLTTWKSNRSMMLAAVIVYIVSLGCLIVGLARRVLPELPPAVTPTVDAIAPLAAVCVFGFALCPYLDLTFHSARQSALTPADSRLAFGLGFGVFFFSMILFTLAYTGVALRPLRGIVAAVLLTHMTVQLSFTIAVHVIAAMSGPLGDRDLLSRHLPGWDVLAAAVIGVALAFIPMRHTTPYHGVAAGEIIYRLFMASYGLVFPAYVWLAMIPSPFAKPPGRSLAVFAAAVLLAAPFYWLGFIEQKMLWLLPGLAIVLLARLAVPRTRISS